MNSWYLSKTLADERMADVERHAQRYSRLHPLDDDTTPDVARPGTRAHRRWGRRLRVAGV